MPRQFLYRVLAYVPLLLVLFSVITLAATSQTPQCNPGEYAYNLSGQFICIPAITQLNTTYASLSAYYVSDGVANITLTCLSEVGCTFSLRVINLNTSTTILDMSTSLAAGEQKIIQVNVANSPPLLINASVNGVQLPLFFVQPKFKELQPGLLDQLKQNNILYTMALLLYVSVPVGLLLRGSGKEAGIAIAASSVLLPRILIEFSAPTPLAYGVTAISLIMGVMLAVIYE